MSATTRAVSTLNGRTLLQPSDFTYLGSFAMPSSIPFTDGSSQPTEFSTASLALRYVSGSLRLMSLTEGNNGVTGCTSGFGLYEVSVPTLTTSPPWNTATVVAKWGNVWQGRSWFYYDSPSGWTSQLNGGGTGWNIHGIYWDPIDARLYWAYGTNYGTAAATDDPTLGFVTLNDTASTFAAYGPWRSGAPKRDEGGIVGISSWFATAYLSGQRTRRRVRWQLLSGQRRPRRLRTRPRHRGPSVGHHLQPNPDALNHQRHADQRQRGPGRARPVGSTSYGLVTIPYNATAAQVVSAFNAVLGASSATASGGPLPGTPVVFRLQVACTFVAIDKTNTNINAGTGQPEGSPTDSLLPR